MLVNNFEHTGLMIKNEVGVQEQFEPLKTINLFDKQCIDQPYIMSHVFQ